MSGQRFPTISYISQEKVIDIGGSIELECSVQYVRDFPVLWIKVDNVDHARTIPLSTGSNLIVKDSRFSLRYDQASSTYTLQVYLYSIAQLSVMLTTWWPFPDQRYPRKWCWKVPVPSVADSYRKDLSRCCCFCTYPSYHFRQFDKVGCR